MAKGFTVKAKTPVKKKAATTPQYDYAKAKEMIKGKTVVFCLPGRGVSYQFLKSFVSLCFDLVQSGAKYSDITRLFFNGKFCPLQVSWCKRSSRT